MCPCKNKYNKHCINVIYTNYNIYIISYAAVEDESKGNDHDLWNPFILKEISYKKNLYL